MIPSITYEDIIKTLRKVLIDYAKVRKNRILNALSARGTDLSDMINSTETDTYAMSDVFILFELLKDQDGNNFETAKDDTSMLTVNAYQFHIMIYGNKSDECLQRIKAVFKFPDIALSLREKGIHITGVSSGESINEFLNNTIFLRNDVTISLETRFDVDNIKEEEYFNHKDTVKYFNGIITKNV